MMPRPSEQGFSLIEALVALLVLAIGAAGLVRAAEAHVDSIRGLERRAAAQLVAQNRLAELALPDMSASGSSTVEMLGQRWNVAVNETSTDDPDLVKVAVMVSDGPDKPPLITLDGFRDKGTTAP
jgi:general secretion pathway protein I